MKNETINYELAYKYSDIRDNAYRQAEDAKSLLCMMSVTDISFKLTLQKVQSCLETYDEFQYKLDCELKKKAA